MSLQPLSKAEKQIEAARNELGRIEESISKTIDHSNINNLINEASSGLATASLAMKSADEIISRETSVEKRQIAKQKLKDLRNTHQMIKGRIDEIKKQAREKEKVTTRTALLSGTTAINSNLGIAVSEEALMEKEGRTFGYAETRLGEYINVGANTLDSLRNQRSMLKSAQRRVLDAGTQLGLGQSVMKIISRRTRRDRYIFYAGVIAIFLVIYLCWRYI